MRTFCWRLLCRTSLLCAITLAGACAKDPARAKLEYVASGDSYYAQGKYSDAALQYRNALQQDPRFGDARLKLAQSYEKLGDTPNAMREYIRAADALPANVEAQVKAGTYLLTSRLFEEARTRAQAALKIDPKNIDALIVLGSSLAGLKDFDGALADLEEAVKLDPSSAAAHGVVGAVQMARGRPAEAEAAFRKAVEMNPKLPAAHLALANYLWAAGRPADAEQSMKQVLTIEPKNPLAHRALATLYMATGRAPLAEEHLKALSDMEQSSARPLTLALADYYLVMNRPDDALRVLEGISESKDARSAAQTRLAAIHFAKDGHAAGNKIIDEVLARDPRYVPALLVKTRFQIADKKFDDALKFARAAALEDPQSIQAHYLIGTIQKARQHPGEAIQAFSEVLKINPRATAAQIQLAQLNLQQGQTAAALQLASDAAKQVPNDPNVQLTLVRTLLAGGRLEQAQNTIAALATARPDSAVVQATAGDVALARKDRVAARKAYARAAELDPSNLEALTGLVQLDILDRNPSAAKARVDQQLARSPSDGAVCVVAARVYATTGDLKRAEELLRKAIEVDPANLQAYGMLGQLYASQNRLAEARASFESILKAHPDAVGLNTIVAILYEAEGNRTEARKRYERILHISPDAPVAANNLAYIYAEDGGSLDVAMQLAQTAKRKLPDLAEVSDTLGWVYLKQNLPDLAIPQLQQAVQKEPSNALLHYHLGVAQFEAGQKINGRKSLEEALRLKLDAPQDANARQLISQP